MPKKLTCDAKYCEFEVQAATVNEAACYMQQHMEIYHDSELDRFDIENMVQHI